MLTAKGFKVYNLKGGINAWNDRTAEGPEDMGMFLLKGDEIPGEIIMLAYGLEEGLRRLYADMIKETDDDALIQLFTLLSAIEEKHKQRLFKLYLSFEKTEIDLEIFEKNIMEGMMEGGFSSENFMEKHADAMKSVTDVLNIAMMLEAQSMDLYARYADKSNDKDVKAILSGLADEEKNHLKRLADLLEKKT